MKKIRLTALMLIGLLLIISGCGSQTPDSEKTDSNDNTVTIQHKLGETTLAKNPKRVVVLDYGALDTLDKLGVDIVGVPKDVLPDYLAKYKDDKYENIGNLKELDFEKINRLKPDLIIISGRQENSYKDLSEIAPTIDLRVDESNYLDSFKNNMRILGQIFGKEDQIEAELSKIDGQISALRKTAEASGSQGLLLMTSGGKLHAFGPGSRYALLYDVLGLKSVMEPVDPQKSKTHGQVVSFEYLAKTNPDYILVIDRDSAIGSGAAARQLLDNELVNRTNAAKAGKIIYLDSGIWYLSGGGLVSTEKMLDDVGQALSTQ